MEVWNNSLFYPTWFARLIYVDDSAPVFLDYRSSYGIHILYVVCILMAIVIPCGFSVSHVVLEFFRTMILSVTLVIASVSKLFGLRQK